MTVEEFLRVYPVRAPNLMWLLGAGASASAAIPTAAGLIWEFKRTLFCAAQRISVKSCEDLSSPIVQQRLDTYFQGVGRFPHPGSPDEYAAYFEAAYPDPKDRRAKLDGFIAGVKPSYGHLVLAALMKMDKARIFWTPNFDKLLEDAAFEFLETASKFVVANLDNAPMAMHAINESRWPIIAKMHGDFQSRRLKNTSDELRTQDAEIRRALIESCRRFGLTVVGYSGRDESILSALEEAINGGRGYPAGLFWCQRSGFPPLPAVAQLIDKAQRAGIQAEILEIQTFDELIGDVIKQFPSVPADIQSKLDRHSSRITEIPLDAPGRGWPVVRLNALPVLSWPAICRRVLCEIGGTKEVRNAIFASNAKALGAKSKIGVICFGSDVEIRRAFSSFRITEFDCHSIEPKRLRYDSAEFGLLRDAFALALESNGPFRTERARSTHILHIDLHRAQPDRLEPLRACVGSLSGQIPKTDVFWSEVLRFRLDYQINRLWMLIEPTVYVTTVRDDTQKFVAADFVRERLAVRYNRQWNALLDAWITLLMGDRQEISLASFGVSDGVDASFVISKITGFSRRSINQ